MFARKLVPTARGLHVVSLEAPRGCWGPPGTGVLRGEGWGRFVRLPEKTSNSHCPAEPEWADSGLKSHPTSKLAGLAKALPSRARGEP